MRMLGNTLAKRKISRWGRRAGLAYAERVGDGIGGEVSVREDNHGCTRMRFAHVRRCWGVVRQGEQSRTLVKAIRVIRGSFDLKQNER